MSVVRTYRIEPFNGAELVIQETYRERDFTQVEYEDFHKLVEDLTEVDQIAAARCQYRLDHHIPSHEETPGVVISGLYLNGSVRELNVRYKESCSGLYVVEEIRRYYGIFFSLHWRNMIACQRDNYGSLFDSVDD